jgi:hypothetical protein
MCGTDSIIPIYFNNENIKINFRPFVYQEADARTIFRTYKVIVHKN